MSTTPFKMILLSLIVPSPTNPRKFFDESKTLELAESIREKEVLQPILVRPKGEKFEIVCGERRYKASQMVQAVFSTRNSIPAIVRELSDQEVREIQLIENFQREDVHPMEESVAIKAAIDSGKYTMEDIAAKVGKKIQYIRQRMKLNELSADWQKVFFANRITISLAMQLAAMPSVQQKEIFKGNVSEGSGKIELRSNTLEKYKGELNKAKFDLADATLIKKAGACTNCQFNTTFNKLFTDQDESPRCSNISCFTQKTEISFGIELKKAKEDPTIVLIYSGWGTHEIVEKLRKEGYEVYREGHGEAATELEAPVLMSKAEYYEDNGLDDDEDMTEKEKEMEYERHVVHYKKEKAQYDADISSGKYKKAFFVHDVYGDNTGKYTYVRLGNKSNSGSSASANKGNNTESLANIDEEISRLKTKEMRSVQLDREKIWKEVSEQITADKIPAEIISDRGNPEVESNAMALAIIEKIDDYEFKRLAAKVLGMKFTGSHGIYIDINHLKNIKEVTIQQLWQLLRIMMYSNLKTGASAVASKGPCMLLPVLENNSYFSPIVAKITDDQLEKAARRKKKVDARIKELQDKKKELAPKKEKAAPKADPKKSAKAK